MDGSQLSPDGLSTRDFALLTVAALAAAMSYGITLPLLPDLLATKGVFEPAAVARHTGWLTSLYTVALTAMAPVWGGIADRGHHRHLLSLTLLATAGTLAVLPYPSALTGIYAVRIAAGVASAGVLPIVLAAVAIGTDSEGRPTRFGWISSATALGFLLGPLLGEIAIHATGSGVSSLWIAPVAVAACCAACAWAVSLVRIARVRTGNARNEPSSPSIGLAYAWATTAVAVMAVTVVEVGVTLLTRESNWPGPRSVSLYFGVCSAVMVVMQLWVFPRAQKRWGAWRVEEIALLALVLGLASLAKPAAWIPVFSFVLAGAGIGVLIPSMAVRIAAATPKDRAGGALGWQASFANIGQAIGAAATGWLYGIDTGAPFVLAAVAVFCFFVRYCLWLRK